MVSLIKSTIMDVMKEQKEEAEEVELEANADIVEEVEVVTLSKDDYEALQRKIEQLEEQVTKANQQRLFFRSNKLKGSDDDFVQQTNIKQDRDIFGRRI
jgi:squalene cyclase